MSVEANWVVLESAIYTARASIGGRVKAACCNVLWARASLGEYLLVGTGSFVLGTVAIVLGVIAMDFVTISSGLPGVLIGGRVEFIPELLRLIQIASLYVTALILLSGFALRAYADRYLDR